MYLNYYNLKSEPFNITPDPDLLFMSPSHKEALAAVIYGVNSRKGFVEIIGEVGVGKTTIIRSFLNRISNLGKTENQNIRPIYIFNANVSFKALLRTIYQNLGQSPKSDEIGSMVDQLHMILIDEYKAGRNVVLIIDEVQNMPIETLENLRMLSNLETSTDKLIQVIFSGQPEFEKKLNLHALRQLKQRIAIRVRILPLSKSESLQYISHRLARTVTKDPDIFTQGALQKIIREAHGIPRKINVLCDNCLITSFGNQQKKVTAKVAKEIISDLRMEEQVKPIWRTPLIISLLIVACIFSVYLNSGFLLRTSGASPALPIPHEVSAGKPDNTATTDSLQQGTAATAKPADPPTAPLLPAPTTTPGHASGVQVLKEADAAKPHTYKVVKKGDTLAGLAIGIYGSVDKELFNLIRRHNPNITNINLIQDGEKIYFPAKKQAATVDALKPAGHTGE